MAAECAQVVSLGDKQKSSSKNVPPPKNLCQPFTLRLVLGVPIIKSENKAYRDLEALFTTYSKNKPIVTIESETFWSHIHTGVNSIVKQLEDAVRDSSPSSSCKTDPFAIVLLDFAWLNSPLGHHLAHICSNMPTTSLVAVDPPSTLSRLLDASTRISCVGIRPLMMPHTERLPLLHDFMRMCAALADKELPPDPALAASAAAAASAMLGSSAALEGGLGGAPSAGSQAAPQYVPILPKPAPTLLQQHHATAGVDIATSPSATGYVISAGGAHGASGLISNSLLAGPSHASVQKPQMVSKPPVPRPAVRHVPADDWLTYKLDHARLYKCGADISKELENHSLYIHDVADIWALYPRQKQQQQQSHHASSSADLGASSGAGGLRRACKSKSSRLPPPPPPKRGRHVPPPPPQRLEDEEDDDFFDEDDDLGDIGDEDAFDGDYDDAYLEGRHHQHHTGGSRSRYSRHTGGVSSSSRGLYRRQQQQATPQQSSSYGGLGRRRSRRSPRW